MACANRNSSTSGTIGIWEAMVNPRSCFRKKARGGISAGNIGHAFYLFLKPEVLGVVQLGYWRSFTNGVYNQPAASIQNSQGLPHRFSHRGKINRPVYFHRRQVCGGLVLYFSFTSLSIVLGLFLQPLHGGLFIFLYRHLYRQTIISADALSCRLDCLVSFRLPKSVFDDLSTLAKTDPSFP